MERVTHIALLSLLTMEKREDGKIKRSKAGDEQMAVSEWHLVLCLISGESICL